MPFESKLGVSVMCWRDPERPGRPHPHILSLPDRSVDVGETTSTSVWRGETGFHGRSLGKEKTRDRLKICMLMIDCLSP